MTLPPEAKVEIGYDYGTNGTEFEGTYTTTPTEIAAAVWNAQLTSHSTDGTFGAFVKKLLTVAKFLGLK